MGILILITKITGIFKLQIITSIYGIKSVQLDLFNAANVIPEFIFTIVAIGGINAALIPVFNKALINEKPKQFERTFSTIVNLFFVTLLAICVTVFIFAPQIIDLTLQIKLLNTENQLSGQDYETFVNLLRILLFSPIILCISSIFSSILQIRSHFWITALAPLFYNLGIIGSALFLTTKDNDITILAYGVILGSLLHFFVQLPAILQSKIKYNPFIFDVKDYYVKSAVRQTLPRILGLTSDYIGNIFQTFLALRLLTGSLTAFRLAVSIRDLATSIFGLSIAQATFPKMAEMAARNEMKEFQKLFSYSIRVILLWTIPITCILIVLRTPVVQLLFGIFSKNIDFSETNLVSYTFLFLSLGIIFYAVLGVVNRAFYSLNDSRTPTVVSLVSIFFEIALTYALVNLFSHFDDSLSVSPFFIASNFNNYFLNGNSPAAIGGIALASTIAIFFNLSALIILLKGKGADFFYQSHFIFHKLASGIFMTIVGLLWFKYMNPILASATILFDTTTVLGVLSTTIVTIVVMSFVYYAAEVVQGDEDAQTINKSIVRIKDYASKAFELIRRNKVRSVGSQVT